MDYTALLAWCIIQVRTGYHTIRGLLGIEHIQMAGESEACPRKQVEPGVPKKAIMRK